MRVILFSKCWRFNKFNMLTNSPKISDITKGVSPTELLLEQWKNMIKQPSCIFKQCLGPFNMFTVKGYSETGLFRHLCNLVVFNFRIHISYEGHLVFENVENVMQIWEMQKKIEKNLFVSLIIAFQLIAIHFLNYKENTCQQQSMCLQAVFRF